MDSGEKELRNCNSEDRISQLPDDLIHRILSNMDAADVIQTCLVSTRWRHVWRSVPQLNLHGCPNSPNLSLDFPKFTKFVSRLISNRYHQSHINLNSTDSRQWESGIFVLDYPFRTIQNWLIKKIALHTSNAQKLNLNSKVSVFETFGKYGDVTGIPLSVFNNGSMKELRLNTVKLIATNLDGSSWNLQTLTTLVCVGVTFTDNSNGKSIDYFSKLLNLRHLTLTGIRTLNYNRLNIFSPSLKTLTISRPLGMTRIKYVVSAPNLSSFNVFAEDSHSDSILTSDGFPCLERVNINVYTRDNQEKVTKDIIFGLFHKLGNAMSLTLSMRTVCLLSSFPELRRNQISPFCNLKLLNLVKDRHPSDSSIMPPDVINYLCNSSPSPPVIKKCEN